MEEQYESNKTNNAPTQETQLAGIEKRLGHMEGLLKDTQKQIEEIRERSQLQWTYSIGFGGMAVGAGMVTAGASSSNTSFVHYGALVFFLGVAIMVIPPMLASKSKKR